MFLQEIKVLSYVDELNSATASWERDVRFSVKFRPLPIFRYTVQQSSAIRNFLIETMTLEIEMVVLKRIESAYQNSSYKFALIDKLCISDIRSEEPNQNWTVS